jgi:hypothetical protein
MASSRGHEAVVRLLLDWPRHAPSPNCRGGQAVNQAGKNGHYAIMQLLLDRADTAAAGTSSSTTVSGGRPGGYAAAAAAAAPPSGDSRCEHCGRCAPRLMRCGRCRRSFFCGKECQTAGWKSHKATCTRAA